MARNSKKTTPPTPAAQPTGEPQENAAFELARTTLTGDVRDMILGHIKTNKNPLAWDMASEAEQERTIAQAMHFAEDLVRRTVDIVAADGRKVIPATLVHFKVKGGQLAMQVDTTATIENMTALAMMRGQTMQLVVADDVPYQGHRKPVKVNRDQASMLPPEDGAPPAGEPAPPDQPPPPPPAPPAPPAPQRDAPPTEAAPPPPAAAPPAPADKTAPPNSGDKKLDEAYREGELARRKDLPASANPHPMGYLVFKSWLAGWNAMDTAMKAPATPAPSAIDDIEDAKPSDFLPTDEPHGGADAPPPAVEPPGRQRPPAAPATA